MKKRYFVAAFLVFLLLGSAILFYVTPVGTRSGGWTHVVLRNWRDFGFRNLDGKLVINVGGQGLPEHRITYAGHRPFGFYPAYVVQQASGREDGLAFHLLLSLIIGLGIWRLLGCGLMGMTTALLSVFSPGYLRLITALDPLGMPVVLGVPFMCWIREMLGREKPTARTMVLVTALVAVYATLNWTTILAFGITVAYLTASLAGKLKRVLLFALLAGAAGALVLVVSLASKTWGSELGTTSNHFKVWYNSYLFGPLGYDGNPMTWRRAITRLAVVNALALLPLWLLFVGLAGRVMRRTGSLGGPWLKPLWPLMIAVLFIGILRNYFAHHPWMAGPVLICGIVFTLRLLLDHCPPPATEETQIVPHRTLLAAGLLTVASFIYCLAILTCLRVNEASINALIQLTRANTLRDDIIYFSPRNDPWIGKNVGRFANLTDRSMVALPESEVPPEEKEARLDAKFLLTAQVLDNGQTWLDYTRNRTSVTEQFIASGLQWYRSNVAKRAEGDRLEVEPVLYLYKLP